MLNKNLQITCDAYLDDVFNQTKTLQEKYKTEDVVEDLGLDDKGNPLTRTYSRNKYFQLLETHTTIPADGVEIAQDLGDKTPVGQKETLTNFGLVLPLKQPCSFSISPYESPVGWGFQITAKVIDSGVEYQKVMNYGDEVQRESPWDIVTQESG